jgi:(p)ppGpp synthase/HD superfamily hydrolase
MPSKRFEQAFVYASQLHKHQKRKGTNIPYIAHLLGVTALVFEDGGDEDQAIAALLHDAVEDQGGKKTLEEIRVRFGNRIARIVERCTDSYETPKPEWRKRKTNYLDHLNGSPLDVQRVALADKVHNARSILRDLRVEGNNVWKRFNGKKEGTLWYYQSLVKFDWDNNLGILASELKATVSEIVRIAN